MYDITGNIIAFEQGELDRDETITLFSHLVKSRLAWSLQGSYGRAAHSLITQGILDRQGNILECASCD